MNASRDPHIHIILSLITSHMIKVPVTITFLISNPKSPKTLSFDAEFFKNIYLPNLIQNLVKKLIAKY